MQLQIYIVQMLTNVLVLIEKLFKTPHCMHQYTYILILPQNDIPAVGILIFLDMMLYQIPYHIFIVYCLYSYFVNLCFFKDSTLYCQRFSWSCLTTFCNLFIFFIALWYNILQQYSKTTVQKSRTLCTAILSILILSHLQTQNTIGV